MTRKHAEALKEIEERTGTAIFLLKTIRGLAVKGKAIPPSDIADLRELIDSLRHHADIHNEERLQP